MSTVCLDCCAADDRPKPFGSDLTWHASDSQPPSRPTPPAVSLHDASGVTAEPGRILVVDDDPEHCAYMAEILSRRGYRSAMALNGRDALTRLEQDGFDAVVTDVYMPDLDGIELVRELRRRWPDLQIIAVTGRGERHQPPNGVFSFLKFLGVSRLLVKPFEPRELSGAVRKALGR